MNRDVVTSSVIATVGYDRNARRLEIGFRSGTTYSYYLVPERIYSELMAADSKGNYFSKHIRGKFPFDEVE
jgi:hypothetical protein